MDDRAHARRGDPATSHRAADVVTPGLNAIQRQVEAFAIEKFGGFLDLDLVAAIPDLGPSTLRTRRAELVDRNIILDSGNRKTPEGHASPHTIWIHRNYVAGPGPLREPPAPASREDKALGKAMAEELARYAVSQKAEGRLFHTRLEEAARIMRLLST